MPQLNPTNKVLEDVEKFRSDKATRKKIAKTMAFLENNPLHTGLNAERITNDPAAWSVRVDRKVRLSFEPLEFLPSGMPDWSGVLLLLRLLNHDDLYKNPRRSAMVVKAPRAG